MQQFDQMDRRRDETQVPIIKLEKKKQNNHTWFEIHLNKVKRLFTEVNSNSLTTSETLK